MSDIASDFHFPIDYLAHAVCSWGADPPIDVEDRLGDLVNGEQCFALLEAITTLDPAEVDEAFCALNVAELSKSWGVEPVVVFEACVREGLGENRRRRREEEGGGGRGEEEGGGGRRFSREKVWSDKESSDDIEDLRTARVALYNECRKKSTLLTQTSGRHFAPPRTSVRNQDQAEGGGRRRGAKMGGRW